MSTTVRRARALYVPASGGGGFTGYAAAVMADSPGAYYRLGELSAGDGTTWADSSGNHRDLTNASGGNGLTSASGLLAGDADGGAGSPVGNRRASLTHASWMDVTTFTLECLFNTTSTGILFGRYTGTVSSSAWAVYRNGTSPSLITCSGGSQTISNGSTSVFNSTTYHFAVTCTGGTALAFYVNGSAAGTASVSAFNSSSTADLFVMTDSAGNNGSTGVVDEIAFYPTALSSTRIAAHAALR